MLFYSATFALGWATTIPYLTSLESMDKANTHTQLALCHNCWMLIFPTWKSMPLIIFLYPVLPASQNFSAYSHLDPVKHPWLPACSTGHRPQLPWLLSHARPHMVAVFFFQSMAKLLSSLVSAFSFWDQEVLPIPSAQNWPWAFFTDRSETN